MVFISKHVLPDLLDLNVEELAGAEKILFVIMLLENVNANQVLKERNAEKVRKQYYLCLLSYSLYAPEDI